MWNYFSIKGVFLLLSVYHVMGCTIPDSLVGTWTSSDKGTIELNSTHLINYSIYNKGGQTFECFDNTGTYYSFKTQEITLFNAVVIAALCIEFTQIKTSMFKYVIKTSQLSQADDERFMYVPATTNLTSADACDDTSNTEYSLIIDSSISVSSFVTTCPDVLLGVFGYVSNITTSGECNGTGSLDVCTDSTKMSFNYTACSIMQAYSSGGELNCIYSLTSGTSTQVYMYNLDAITDESTTYRFMCYVVEASVDGNVYASQYPRNCYSGQTSKSVTSPGGLIVLTASATCVPSESTGLTAAASAAIAIGILLIIIILILIIGFIVYKKTRKVDPGPPDQGVAPAATRMPLDKSRPGTARNLFHKSDRWIDDEIETRDKVPRLERELTQHSTLRQQVITPSVVNPVVREWTDVGDSDNLTLIDSDLYSRLDLRTPSPQGVTGLTPVKGI